MGTDVDALLYEVCLGIAKRLVELVHQTEGKGVDLLLLVGGQAAVNGICRPQADGLPVLVLDGGVEAVEGAQQAGVGVGLQLLPQVIEALDGRLFDGLGHLFGAVGGNGLDPLHGHEGTVHYVIVSLGDDPLLGLGAVGQDLAHRLGAGLDAVHDAGGGGGDGLGHLTHRLHGLLDGLGAVRRHLGDGLDVLEHAVHHLARCLGDDPLLLLFAVGQGLVDRLHGAGHAVFNGGRAVRDGFDHFGGGLLCAGGRLFAGTAHGSGDRIGGSGDSGRCCLGRCGFFLRLSDAFGVALPALLCSLVQLGAVVVIHCAVVGSVIGFFCGTDAILQVGQRGGCALDLGDQLIEPVHHRSDGALGNVLDHAECRVDLVAEDFAGFVSRNEPSCHCCNNCNKNAERIGGNYSI